MLKLSGFYCRLKEAFKFGVQQPVGLEGLHLLGIRGLGFRI